MHLKRQRVPKKWPIKRKGTKYIVRPKANVEEGVPILVFIRDLLQIAQNRKEVKKAIHEKNLLINDRPVRNEKNAVLLFDKITIIPAKKSYTLSLSKYGKFALEEISEKEAHYKIAKVIDKKVLKGKKVQLNLSDGRNYLSNLKCKVNDSIKVDFKKKEVEKCLDFKEGAEVIVFAGKHTGKKGKITKINTERKMVELGTGGKKINALIKQIMVIE